MILDRYRIGAPLEAGALRRAWRAEDVETGEPVVVVALAGHVALRPGAREAWANYQPDPHPALLPILARAEVDEAGTRVSLRVYPAFEPAPRQISPDALDPLVPWLAAALPAARTADLDPDDLVLDPTGIPRLCPTGIPPSQGLSRPTLVEPDPARRARASLAALLRARLAGAPAPPALRALPEPPPAPPADPPRLTPSPQHQPQTPPASSLSRAPQPGATALVTTKLVTTKTAPPAPTTPRSRRRYRVLVPARALPAADRDRALRRSGVAPEAWGRLSERPVSWRMLATDHRDEADALVLALHRAGLPAARADLEPDRGPALLTALLALASLVSTLLLGPMMLLLTALFALLSVGFMLRAWRDQDRLRAADLAWDTAASTPVDPLTALRRLCVDPEIPTTIRQDLGPILDDAEARAAARLTALQHATTLPLAERSPQLARIEAETQADDAALQALLAGLGTVHTAPGDAAAPLSQARRRLRQPE